VDHPLFELPMADIAKCVPTELRALLDDAAAQGGDLPTR
jgi:hypothetical protein